MIKKITPFQYAVLLYEITLKLGEPQLKKTIEGFLGILAKNNDLGKIKQIIREFEIYEKKQRGVQDVEIVSAKALSQDAKRQIIEAVGAKGSFDIKERVDSNLLGGIRVSVGDRMVDGSLRKKLRELNKLLIC